MRWLVLPACAIVLTSIAIAIALHAGIHNMGNPSQRAARLSAMGDLETADSLYREALSARRSRF